MHVPYVCFPRAQEHDEEPQRWYEPSHPLQKGRCLLTTLLFYSIFFGLSGKKRHPLEVFLRISGHTRERVNLATGEERGNCVFCQVQIPALQEHVLFFSRYSGNARFSQDAVEITTPANMHDTYDAPCLLAGLKYCVSRLNKIWADQAYQGWELYDWCRATGDGELKVVKRPPRYADGASNPADGL
jgi:hypothetical protein